jgi:hypothetical protein
LRLNRPDVVKISGFCTYSLCPLLITTLACGERIPDVVFLI